MEQPLTGRAPDDPQMPASPTPRAPDRSFPVVGLGASAGGLQAIQTFFDHTPPDTGMAFVVILHLSPDYDSQAATLLQAHTAMPVTQVTGVVPLAPDHVYVIPPARHLLIVDGHLRLEEPASEQDRHAPIDHFFRTLADTHDSRAAAVILSGTGSDGAVGLKRIKEHGGTILVQDPQEAEWDGMPRNAIATGLVDFVLPVAALPQMLGAYWRRARQLELPVAEGDGTSRDEAALREVLALLQVRTNHDFSHYKRPTILRRLGRRMQVTGVSDLPGYLEVLHSRSEEVQALLQDLLISVTNFFRDRAAWTALEAIIPLLFANKGPGDQVRVWVTACATGEEAYSVAMLLQEHARTLDHPPAIQVFATDIDDDAIRRARQGSYPETIAADVAPARLQRFFVFEHGCYRVKQELRDLVLFAHHNVLRDPPFSKLDLITCRNLLIYLNREAQEQVVRLFHFTLRPGGYLLLGSAESPDSVPQLFDVVAKGQRLFKRRDNAALPPALPARGTPALPESRPAAGPRRSVARGTLEELHGRLARRYTPPSVIVNADYEIVHLSEGAGRFLQLEAGEPSVNLLRVAHPDLRLDLSTVLLQSAQQGTRGERRGIRVTFGDTARLVDIVVEPIQAGDWPGGYLFMLFHDAGPASATAERGAPVSDEVVRQLEAELERTRDQLRMTVEEYETAGEEYKAANEELTAINEELRAAGEELETSKEELQAVNEELQTVNQELKHKVEETTQAHNDLQNLVAATEIATLFLDRELRLTRYTPSVEGIFNLIPGDLHRPLAHITHTLRDDRLVADAREVLTSLQPITREVEGVAGQWYLVHLRPYRTIDDHIAGVVVTFVDITERKRAEDALAADLAGMRRLYDLHAMLATETDLQVALDAILAAAVAFVGTERGTVQLVSDDGERLEIVAHRGYANDSVFVDYFRTEGSVVACDAVRRQRRRLIIEDIATFPDLAGTKDREVALADGIRATQSTPMISRTGDLVGVLSTQFPRPHRSSDDELRLIDLLAWTAADFVERHRAGEAVRRSEQRLQRVLETDAVGVLFFDQTGTVVDANQVWLTMTGYTREQIARRELTWRAMTPPAWIAESEAQMDRVTATGRIGPYEKEYILADGSRRWMLFTGRDLGDGTISEYCIDISARKAAEAALRASEERLRLVLESVQDYAIFTIDPAGRVTSWNEGARRLKGYTTEEILGQPVQRFYTPEDVAAGKPAHEMETALREGRSEDEGWRVRKDGARFWANEIMTPLYTDDGTHLGFTKISRDLTARKQAEDAVARALAAEQAARAEVEATLKTREQFLSIASHELRTPLTPLLGYTGMLRRSMAQAVDGRQRKLAETIERQATRLNALIETLLDVSRLQRGQFALERRPLELAALTAQIADDFRLTLPPDGARHTLTLVAPGEEIPVLADAHRLEEVLHNLLGNAVKYSPAGGTIRVRVARQDGAAVLEVADEGIGIPAEAQARLFEPFFRAGNVGPNASGFGLGLYIVQEIVQRHGGHVKVESAEGQGTTFRVVLPLHVEP